MYKMHLYWICLISPWIKIPLTKHFLCRSSSPSRSTRRVVSRTSQRARSPPRTMSVSPTWWCVVIRMPSALSPPFCCTFSVPRKCTMLVRTRTIRSTSRRTRCSICWPFAWFCTRRPSMNRCNRFSGRILSPIQSKRCSILIICLQREELPWEHVQNAVRRQGSLP